jgi:hypothetical protein
VAHTTKTYYRKAELPPMEDTNFFHYASSFDWYDAIPAYTPLMIVAFDEEGKPVAAMFAVIARVNRLFKSRFFKRCFISQQPAFFREGVLYIDVFHQLISHLVREVDNKVFFIRYDNLDSAIFGYKGFRENNFYSVKWISVRNSLQRKRKIWAQLSASRKNQVNKAEKKGLVIEEFMSEDGLPEIYTLIKKTNIQKITRRFPSFKYFENFYHYYIKQGKGKILLTRYQGKIIGGIILGLEKKTTAYCLYYWGKSKRYKFLHPAIFTIYSAMTIAEREGFSYFDFMDTGFLNESTGQTRFLLQFGGKQCATRQWYRFNSRLINFFANKFYD